MRVRDGIQQFWYDCGVVVADEDGCDDDCNAAMRESTSRSCACRSLIVSAAANTGERNRAKPSTPASVDFIDIDE